MSYKKNISSTFVNQILLMILGFVISIVSARALGAYGKGQFAYFMLIFGMVAKFGNLGINDSLSYFIKRTDNDNQTIINNNFSFLVIITGIYLVGFTLLHKLGIVFVEYQYHIVILGVLYVFFNFMESNLKSIYMINEEIFISNRYKLISTILKVLFIVIMYMLGYLTVSNFIYLNILVFALPTLLMSYNIKFRFNFTINFKLIKNQLNYGFILYLSALFIFLSYKVDQFMIRGMLGLTELGVYTVGVHLAELVFLIPHSIINPLRGKLFNLSKEKNIEKEYLTAKTTKYTFFVCVILMIFGYIMTPIVPLVYGDDFSGAMTVIRILFIGVVFASVGKVSSNFFFTEGIPKVHLVITFIVFVSNIIMNILFIPRMGINGAALASTISYFIYGAIYVAIFIRRGKLTIKDFFWLSKKDILNIKNELISLNHKRISSRRGGI